MTTMIEELTALKTLLDQGILSQEEFNAKKAQILAASMPQSASVPPPAGPQAQPATQVASQAATQQVSPQQAGTHLTQPVSKPSAAEAVPPTSPQPTAYSVPHTSSQPNPCAAPTAAAGTYVPAAPDSKSKIAAGLLAIFLGSLGIHKFYLGYTQAGIIMLLVTILGSFVIVGPLAMCIIALIEGIIYLTKTDEQFYLTYVVGRKPWF